MVVIGNGIDENTFATTASFDLKRQLGVGAATHLVCAGGRFTEQKGFDYLVGAVPAVVRKFPGVRFVIVGDGPLMGPLVEKTGRLGVKDVVVFLGYRNDILEIFSLADAIAVPSLFEGMPNVVLEAMALGKTVVGSDIPEIREVVEEGKTGFLVPVRDAGRLAERLIAVLEDGATREEVGRQAKEFARAGFSVSSMVGKYEEIYEKLLPGKAG